MSAFSQQPLSTPALSSSEQQSSEQQAPFRFELHKSSGSARLATLHTPHGAIPLPVFAPVGTQANVKTLEPRDLHELQAKLILANTYHLYMRPGHELVKRMGGLHKFMAWQGPILTDSGGYQVFSLAHQRKLDNDGVTFRSHIDGSQHRFTPERVMEIEQALGPDIAMVLDECPDPLDFEYNQIALVRTHHWAERCKVAHTRPDQALFGIVQGGVFPELRQASARFLRGLDFHGYAIGGLAVGETKDEMYATLDATYFIAAVCGGVDLFDCVLPTRIARNAALLTPNGRMNLRNAQYAEDPQPVQEDCECYTCRTFSRAYLRHLYKAGEVTALRLGTIHNIHYLLDLMRRIHQAIANDRLDDFRAEFYSRYRIPDQAVRHEQRARRKAAILNQFGASKS
jgi:queuine tRNA-ribosyltransferase